MHLKQGCMECKGHVMRSNDYELIQNMVWLKSTSSFNYTHDICDSCVTFLSKGEFEGAPPDSFQHLGFLWTYFQSIYLKIKAEMPKNDTSKKNYSMIVENRRKFIIQIMQKSSKDPDNMKNEIDRLVDKIYQGVVGRPIVWHNIAATGNLAPNKRW